MKLFTQLIEMLDSTTKTNEKINFLSQYFASAQKEDAVWALFFLYGGHINQLIPRRDLKMYALEKSGLAEWLFDECYDAVGDFAETISLLIPETKTDINLSLSNIITNYLLPLKNASKEQQKNLVFFVFDHLAAKEIFLWLKFITGNFRIGVSAKIIIKALANISSLPENQIAHRLMGHWQPTTEFMSELLCQQQGAVNYSQPYPFYLTYPLTQSLPELGSVNDWQIEWKWDGIRAQIIKRQQQHYIWSRGEDLMNDRFPELMQMMDSLPDCVLDGEILVWRDDRVVHFSELQKRITRKTVSKKILTELPVIFLAFDILEIEGNDIRGIPLSERRQKLVTLCDNNLSSNLKLSPVLVANDWPEIENAFLTSRQNLVEGLMLKLKAGEYLSGRRRGEWWKLKTKPYTIDAVLVAAQKGQGRRAGLYTDYTFALWHQGALVTFAKAYSGLTDVELAIIDEFIQKNTLERFGPVRTVKPQLVFEIAFEGGQKSKRHKSGVAVRFPRILRWRQDKTIEEANKLDELILLLKL